MLILTHAQMRQLEQDTQSAGLSQSVLMERAALAVAQKALAMTTETPGAILVICGHGNNGADGLAAARLLHAQGRAVTVWRLYHPKPTPMLRAQARLAKAFGVAMVDIKNITQLQTNAAQLQTIPSYALVIDAIAGIGLTRPPTGLWQAAIEALNRSQCRVLAVDVPSGVPADGVWGAPVGRSTDKALDAPSGIPANEILAVRAHVTLALGHAKPGLLLMPLRGFAGELAVADIGLLPVREFTAIALDEAWLAAQLPPRPMEIHKNQLGHAGLIAGSAGMPGAAVLMTHGALRGGAGLVTLYAQTLPNGLPPEAMWCGEDTALSDFWQGKSALGLGPGLGRQRVVACWVHRALNEFPGKLLLDADALNALDAKPDALLAASGRVVITPHPGEFSRLFGVAIAEILANPVAHAQRAAAKSGAVVVLKGATTVVARPQGPYALYAGGNPGMATPGSGDVLSGIITALLAQGMSPWQAACCGVALHGRAGNRAAATQGQNAMSAGDIAENLCF